jgi:hypothetical protein
MSRFDDQSPVQLLLTFDEEEPPPDNEPDAPPYDADTEPEPDELWPPFRQVPYLNDWVMPAKQVQLQLYQWQSPQVVVVWSVSTHPLAQVAALVAVVDRPLMDCCASAATGANARANAVMRAPA